MKVDITDSDVIELQGEFKWHSDWVTCIKIDMNNPNRILSGSRDKSIIVWDLTSKNEKRRTSLSDGEYQMYCLALKPM